jgi:putative zinc finger/helix-turn-helix YgiT family protein
MANGDLTLPGQVFVSEDGTRKLVRRPRYVLGYVVDVDRHFTRRPDGTWYQSALDKKADRKSLHDAKRQCGQIPTPEEIRSIRIELELSQRRAAEIFGGGMRSFQKYESGVTVPGETMARLLRLVAKRPELLNEIGSI